AVVDVDEEPRLEEVVDSRGQRARSAADFDPAATWFLPKGEVPHEAVPEVKAWMPHRPVTRPERDSAPDTEAVLRSVVRSRETNLADLTPVEPDEHSASVQAVAVRGLGAVLGLHLILVAAE